MVDLDEEFARFAAELKSVEEAVKSTSADEAATAQLAPPPLAPPPLAPPPVAQAVRAATQQQTAAAAAPPPLAPPPVLLPPPMLPSPAAAAAVAPSGAYGGPAAGMGFAAQQQQQQQQLSYMGQQMPGYHHQQQQQQPLYGQPDPQQLSYPPPPAAAGSGWPIGSSSIRPSGGLGSGAVGSNSNSNLTGLGSGLPPLNPNSLGLPLNPNSNAPADPETLKRLKEELVQQKQADKAAGGAGEKAKSKVVFREAAGKRWIDPTLQEWPDNDFRIFVGDLGNEVNDDVLSKAFQRYPSFAKAKIIRDKRTNKSKGFGIVSLLDGNDFAKALKEMNGKYIGNRPCKLSRSTWNERGLKGSTGGGGFGSGHTKGSNKRKTQEAPAAAAGSGGAAGGKSNKVQKAIPKFKYHVPIMR